MFYINGIAFLDSETNIKTEPITVPLKLDNYTVVHSALRRGYVKKNIRVTCNYCGRIDAHKTIHVYSPDSTSYHLVFYLKEVM